MINLSTDVEAKISKCVCQHQNFQPNLKLASKAEAYPSEGHTLSVGSLPFPSDFFPLTNTLVYFFLRPSEKEKKVLWYRHLWTIS